MRTLVLAIALCAGLMVPRDGHAQADDEVFYYHTDAIGSVRMVTDEAQQIVGEYDYLPFGMSWQPPVDADNRQFIAGELASAMQAELNHLGAREYQGVTGRFIQPDALGFGDPLQPQSMNLYAYALNNPLRWVDPTGHAPECPTDHCETVTVTAPAPDIGLIQFLRGISFPPPVLPDPVSPTLQILANWLNAPRDQTCMATAIGSGAGLGRAAGTIMGGAGGSVGGGVGGTFALPGGGTIGGAFLAGSAGAASGAQIGTAAGAAIGAGVGSIACMSSGGGGGGGGGNRHENRAFQEAVRRIERAIGRPLRREETQRLHREISKQSYDLREIVDIGIAMFR